MTHRVTCRFEDGYEVVLEAEEWETVYQAAVRQGAAVQVNCLEGTCATCKAECTAGHYTLIDPSSMALSQTEEDAGYVLTCQMRALSDCEIQFPYPSAPIRTRPAVVTAVERVAAAVVRLEVEADGDLTFRPGQYVNIAVPDTGESRSYSIATPPSAWPRAVFYVRLLDGGVMSGYLADSTAPGDRVTLTGPLGGFYHRPSDAPMLMVSGGTGLAPMLSILEHMREGAGPAQRVRLIHGENREEELFALEALESYRANGLDLDTVIAVTEPSADWRGAAGLVTDCLLPGHVEGGAVDAYLCGPPAMIDAARQKLLQFGVARDRIYSERFLPT